MPTWIGRIETAPVLFPCIIFPQGTKPVFSLMQRKPVKERVVRQQPRQGIYELATKGRPWPAPFLPGGRRILERGKGKDVLPGSASQSACRYAYDMTV
jgi:hypothetical protein